MPTPASEAPGLGEAAKRVAEHASALARLELELASLELKRKAGALGAGVGLVVAAGLLVLFGIGFALAAGAAALALALDTWLALLAVAGGVVLLAGLLGVVAVGLLRRGTPPVPQQAIEEARATTEALRRNGQ
jgi:hypothetical protein